MHLHAAFVAAGVTNLWRAVTWLFVLLKLFYTRQLVVRNSNNEPSEWNIPCRIETHSLPEELIEDSALHRVSQRCLNLLPDFQRHVCPVSCHDVAQTFGPTIPLRGDAGTAIHECFFWHPVGALRRVGIGASLHAGLASIAGEQKAHVARILGEVRVEVVVECLQRPSPGGSCNGLPEPGSQKAQMRVAPPKSGQPGPSTDGFHERLQRRTDSVAIRSQRHRAVPCANLLLEGGLAFAHVPLQPQLVPPCLWQVHPPIAEEALVLTHEDQERPRRTHLVAGACNFYINKIRGEGSICQPQWGVEAGSAIQACEEVASPKYPHRLSQLWEGVA
mmetsp:Transcript_28779/g.46203  ORF Transcript_28779/g.46203 Transcript_28779/m.46203 type:complete len:332 (-) Transcript_28779:1090-2085(-)